MPDFTTIARWMSIAPVVLPAGIVALAGLLVFLVVLGRRGGMAFVALAVLAAGVVLLSQTTAADVEQLGGAWEQVAQALQALASLQAALR